MKTTTDPTVLMQTTSHSQPSTPCWCGAVVIIAQHLHPIGVLAKLPERRRFARRRFGHDEVSDVLAGQEAMILVKGGYTPDVLVMQHGKSVRFNFRREETAACSEMVIFNDFGKSAHLPTGETVPVEFLPEVVNSAKVRTNRLQREDFGPKLRTKQETTWLMRLPEPKLVCNR